MSDPEILEMVMEVKLKFDLWYNNNNDFVYLQY